MVITSRKGGVVVDETLAALIIALVSQKGGVGKTSISIAIACELKRRGFRVLLVDADPQRSHLKRAARMGWPEDYPQLRAMDYSELLKVVPELASQFDFIVIDTAGRGYDEAQRAALHYADVAVIPVGMGGYDVDALDAAIEVLRLVRQVRARQEGPRRPLAAALVPTMVNPQTFIARDFRKGLDATGVPVFETVLAHRNAWREASVAGRAVTTYAPRTKAAAEARALVDEILAMGSEKPKKKGAKR